MTEAPASTAPKRPRKAAASKSGAPAAKKAPAKSKKAAAPEAHSRLDDAKKAVTQAASTASARAKAEFGKISDKVEAVDWKAQADHLKVQADQLKNQAGHVARTAAESAKDKTGSAMHGLAKLISDTADTVDSKLGPQYGDYARNAAEAVAGAAQSLDDADLDQLLSEARSFVRKSPAVAIGAAAIAGYVLMRLAKGSGDSAEATAAVTAEEASPAASEEA